MIGTVARNEEGRVAVVTGQRVVEVEETQPQSRRGVPGKTKKGQDLPPKVTMVFKREAWLGKALDGEPWEAKCINPLTRVEVEGLGW